MKDNRKQIIIKYFIPLIFMLIGAVGGYLYYRFVGCATGTCPITSSPFISPIYGGILGLLIGTIITPNKKKNEGDRNA